MAHKTVRIDFNSAEFMLDLPLDTTIVSATSDDGHIILVLDTDVDFEDNATLIYESDDSGVASLTGAN